MFLNNRHYDPTTGVFISVDPLFAKTGEAYVYGGASPVVGSDPSGLEVCYVNTTICWGAGDPQPPRPGTGGGGGGSPLPSYDGYQPSGDPLPTKPTYFPAGMDDYRTVERVAEATNFNPFILLIVYLKEREGWQRAQDSLVRDFFDTVTRGDMGDSKGVTNLQWGAFLKTYQNHPAAFEEFGIERGISKSDLKKRWSGLENLDPGDVELSLAATSFHLQDLADQFAAIDPESISAVPGVTPFEWAIQSYRFNASGTIIPTASGDPLLGPKVGAEIELFREQYATLSERYGI